MRTTGEGQTEEMVAPTGSSGPKVGLPPPEAGRIAPGEHTEAFDRYVEDVVNRLGSNLPFLFPRLEDQIRRRLGLAPRGAASAALTGLVAVGIRLALVLFATALVGEWTGLPWGRWAVILGCYGLFDATQPLRTPPIDIPQGPRLRRWMDDWLALLSTIVRESDLQELADFTRRWYRLPRAAAAGGTVAAIMLGACWLFTPTAMGELPAGSIVLLALLLYDFAVFMPAFDLFSWAFTARQGGYEHHLFWPSPADSPQVQRAMRMATFWGFAGGWWITVYLVLTVVLVSWESPLVLPLGVGFMVLGYLSTIGKTLGLRAGIQKIVKRIRDQRLHGLQNRIDAFGSRYTDLSPQESEQLQGLLLLHNTIRDAPTTPTTTHTALSAVVGLIVPTIMFVVAVFGEVYAERILDAILP